MMTIDIKRTIMESSRENHRDKASPRLRINKMIPILRKDCKMKDDNSFFSEMIQ